MHLEYNRVAIVIGMESTIPHSINEPTLIPKIPATPTGPGVGGTKEWVITKPAARETPSVITDFFVFLDIAFANGDSITKPESQNMGIDTKNPVMAKAISSLPLPNFL